MPRTFTLSKGRYSHESYLVVTEGQGVDAVAIAKTVAGSLIEAGQEFEFKSDGEAGGAADDDA